MAKIRVHVLNFHGIFSHIEIVLEHTCSNYGSGYYGINRWETPLNYWWYGYGGPQRYIAQASSVYSFDIDADPQQIIQKWDTYWYETDKEASILGQNCAVAAQWFLTEFAGVPKPNLSNISWNYLALGLFWPSFIPFPVTLPGRIMSNAQFYIEARDNPELTNQYTYLFLCTSMALATLMFAASVFAAAVAVTILSGGIATIVMTGCAAVGTASTYGFFKAYNLLSAKNIPAKLEEKEDQYPLMTNDPNKVHLQPDLGFIPSLAPL